MAVYMRYKKFPGLSTFYYFFPCKKSNSNSVSKNDLSFEIALKIIVWNNGGLLELPMQLTNGCFVTYFARLRKLWIHIFTDRVRSTRWEVIVSLCLSVHTCGGEGYPARSSRLGGGGGYSDQGVPNQGCTLMWGTPPWVPPWSDLAGRGWGYPTSGTPHQTWLGGGGYPDGGIPPWIPPVKPGQGGTPMGGYPTSDNRWEYLIRHGRYASCVHAGGLSCFL